MTERLRRVSWRVLLALTVPVAGRAEPPRLSGIVIAGEDRVAIFAGGTGQANLVVRPGDRLGEDRVSEITARGVTLSGPGGRTTLVLEANASARAALAAAAPPPPSVVDPYRRERDTETDQ